MNKRVGIGGLVFLLTMLGLDSQPAHAMHISEGILPPQWAVLWFALAIPFIAWGLRDLRVRSKEEPHLKSMVGLVGAAVFVISCMPIPVPTAGSMFPSLRHWNGCDLHWTHIDSGCGEHCIDASGPFPCPRRAHHVGG